VIDQTAQRTMQVPGQGIVPAGRPTIDYKEYPKMMTHPQFQPGKPSPEIKSPHGFTYHGIGTPVRFPPVMVKTPDDEAYHASLGYVSQGKTDPAAFDRAVGNGQIPEHVAYKALEYPKWVQGKLCQNSEEEQKVLGGPTMTQIAAEAEQPALDTEVAKLLDRPDIAKSADQTRIAELEAKVDRLTDLLAKALKLREGPVELEPYEAKFPSTFHRVAAAAEAEVKKRTAPKKKARKQPVLTAQQKNARSEAIKAGLARRKALTESVSAQQGDAASG
jgi:hypothetical protein